MLIEYTLRDDEFDDTIVESIRAQSKGKTIIITIAEFDETDYLLSSEVNRVRLMEALDRVNRREGLVEVKLEDLE